MHIDPTFWNSVPIAAADALAAMHQMVFARVADKKVRSPRWTFELDSDLAVQLQARMERPGHLVRGKAAQYARRITANAAGTAPAARSLASPLSDIGQRQSVDPQVHVAWLAAGRGRTDDQGF